MLHCFALYGTVMYYIVLCCMTLQGAVLFFQLARILCYAVLSCAPWCGAIWC